MEYPKFFYRHVHVAQPLRYKRDEFCLSFLLAFFGKIKNPPKYPKIEIMTDGYEDLFIRLSPLTVTFHSKNDLLIEIMHF